MQDEDGNTEYSMSTDKDDVHNQRGALSYFLPAAMPHIPHDIARKVPGIQEVAQVPNDTCVAQESAVNAHRHAAFSQQRCCALWFHAVLFPTAACLHVFCLT